ncbi:MAG: hemerythrin domain-containing protein [Planctomycetia bacterium]|nr:hemerythrin domain-containing protein [Planctomycetia bacterium]
MAMMTSVTDPCIEDAAYLAEQCLVEHRTLSHVKAALRLALDWQVGPPGLVRKVATVRFTAQSFRRHLERLMKIEEKDGYMDVVGQLKPHLVDRALRLRAEHDTFRVALQKLLTAIEKVSDTDGASVSRLCDDLTAFLGRLDVHDAREADLLQEVVLQDDGGEGG